MTLFGTDIRCVLRSWQWDIHGEARGPEFINRAAAATLAAIKAAEGN
jgi:hypothetical protein